MEHSNTAETRVLIVDDHEIVHQGIKVLFFDVPQLGFTSAFTSDQCLSALSKLSFDLLILDVNLPGTDTNQLFHLIKLRQPSLPILIFSMSPEDIYAKRFINKGALGYLSKSAGSTEIRSAILSVSKGNRYYSQELLLSFAEDQIEGRKSDVFSTLTEREFEIMRHMLKGASSKEICSIMNLHPATVGTHKSNIFSRLGVKNIVELINLAALHGIK